MAKGIKVVDAELACELNAGPVELTEAMVEQVSGGGAPAATILMDDPGQILKKVIGSILGYPNTN